MRPATLRREVREQVRTLWTLALQSCGRAPEAEWADDLTFRDLGGDSAAAVALTLLLDETFGWSPGADVVYAYPTVEAQVDALVARDVPTTGSSPAASATRPDGHTQTASPTAVIRITPSRSSRRRSAYPAPTPCPATGTCSGVDARC